MWAGYCERKVSSDHLHPLGTAWRRRASRNPAAPRDAVSPWEAGPAERRFTVGDSGKSVTRCHRTVARVLEVRIHLPPAASLRTIGSALRMMSRRRVWPHRARWATSIKTFSRKRSSSATRR